MCDEIVSLLAAAAKTGLILTALGDTLAVR
jgi:hypothetical protein